MRYIILLFVSFNLLFAGFGFINIGGIGGGWGSVWGNLPNTFDCNESNRDDYNITTKIVNKEFNLTLVSLDKNRNEKSFTGVVCSRVIDSNENNLSDWNQTNWDNDTKKTISFIINKASKDNYINIRWNKDTSKSCPLDDYYETNSTDDFAIRPKSFDILTPNPIYAGEDFNISFKALDYLDNNSTDYNETNGSSFDIYIKELKDDCKLGNFSVDINFSNGGNTTIANYDEVGDINITLKEISGSEFASVDSDDTDDNDRFITPKSVIITSKPYDLNISYSVSSKWIYMDSNLTQNHIELNITLDAYAKNKSTTLEDFNSTCYAKDINLSLSANIINLDKFNGIYHLNEGNSTYSTNADFSDINFSALDYNWTVNKDSFVKGEGNLSVWFNINRDYSIPISVVDVNLTNINIQTPTAKNDNNISIDENISFYYARLLVKDINLVQQMDTSILLPVAVYDRGEHFSKSLLINWYLQDKNDINFTSVLGTSNDYVYNSDTNVSDFSTDIDIQQSEFNLSIDNDSEYNTFVVIHIHTPKYMWYSKYVDYNDSNQSNCTTHYCIEYNYNPNATSNEAGSGSFIGSEVDNDSDINITNGIKIYR